MSEEDKKEEQELLDFFAGQALPALIAMSQAELNYIYGTGSISEAAYMQAESMLEARGRCLR